MGMRLCDRYDTSKFVDLCRNLRVLNALRRLDIDVSYNDFKISSLLDKLISLNHWPLAIEISNFMDVPMEDGVYRILAHWCLYIMDAHKNDKTSSTTEDMVARRIFNRLEKYPSISYAGITIESGMVKLLYPIV